MGSPHNPGQRRLPGIEVEDRTLPSEQALTGEVLGQRRREALRAFKEALGPCPEGWADEEWTVALAGLAPEAALGTTADRTKQARKCFPGLGAPAAIRAWQEVARRPHVQEFVREFRAVEALDVLAQREQVRGVLTGVMLLAVDVLDLRAVDPSGAAKCGAAAVAAAKVLIELDDLRADRAADMEGAGGGVGHGGAGQRALPGEDPHEALARKVALVMEDVQRRANDAAE